MIERIKRVLGLSPKTHVFTTSFDRRGFFLFFKASDLAVFGTDKLSEYRVNDLIVFPDIRSASGKMTFLVKELHEGDKLPGAGFVEARRV
jgi:hypothetical protein